MYGVEAPDEILTYRTLRQYFSGTLDRVAGRLTQHKKLVLLIDGLDALKPAAGARSLSWLPDAWPRHVHVVLTTSTSDGLSMRNLSNHINAIIRRRSSSSSSELVVDGTTVAADDFFFAVVPLSLDELDAVVDLDLTRHSRTLTVTQRKVCSTGAALAANPRPLQTHLSCPACIASGNFILEFPSINSRSRLFSRWRMRARSVEQTTSFARACVNVRIGEFMLGNSRTKLPAQCMLGRRGEFEGVAICNAEKCQPCI